MELAKMKLKYDEVRLFNVDKSVEEEIVEQFTISDISEQILTTIVKEEEFTMINEFIDTLDLTKDFTMWILYPKGTSKQYKGIVEVNRDDIRTKINDKVKTVAMVSLDSDWSAMRLRNSKYSK